MKVNNIEKSILKTLIYSDIFGYPLTLTQVYRFLESKTPVSKSTIKINLNQALKLGWIEKNGNYYFLSGRNKIVQTRSEREKESIRKLKIARRAAKFLRLIPSAKLIGVSGSLASKNCKKTDDIDLFIIASANTLWLTRFLVNVFLSTFGLKRTRQEYLGMDKVCPNMFIEEGALKLSINRRNIFVAREISQLLVLVDKDQVYKRFLADNIWINKILPNIKTPKKIKRFPQKHNNVISFVNNLFFVLQFLYMSGRMTKEEVGPKIARFHPQDKMELVMELYKSRCKRYFSGLLQDIDSKRPILYI